jgi:hypothetical protein
MLAWLKRLFFGSAESRLGSAEEQEWNRLSVIIRETEIRSRELVNKYKPFA